MEQSSDVQSIELVSVKRSFIKAHLDYLQKFNLYNSKSNDIDTIHRERLSTRLFVCSLFILMSSTIIYTALLSSTINVTVYNPSENKFREIYEKYPNTYTCPCSHVSVQYNKFAHFQITFHEVCKSEFISQEWIDTSYSANVSFIPPNDIRTILSHFWTFVRSFCALANVNVIDASNQFNSTNLVSRFVQPQHLIETKANATLALALNSTLNNLKRNLLLTREIILSNGLLSSLATNFFFYISFLEQSPFYSSIDIGINATSFPDGCSCEKSNGCSRSAVIFESNATSHSIKVPGMMFDCLPLDGALASSLKCFYDSSCLSLIQNVSLTNMRPSLLSNHSRFKHNTTLMTLVDELMIEELIMTVVFSSYYSICNPKYCTYSYTHKFDILFMITFTTGAFGGVSILLRFIAPLMIKLIFKIHSMKRRNNSINVNNSNQFNLSCKSF
ncbi:unnamed protein product [Rotaria sp. Silwood2]|nr:unnamed protein product [Rotaria sp. Silwood2]